MGARPNILPGSSYYCDDVFRNIPTTWKNEWKFCICEYKAPNNTVPLKIFRGYNFCFVLNYEYEFYISSVKFMFEIFNLMVLMLCKR